MAAPRACDAPAAGAIREHVLGHLGARQQAALRVLLAPVTLDEAAPLLGLNHRNSVEHRWHGILDGLGIDARAGHGVNRLRVARIAWGLDPCFCEEATR